MREKSRDDTDGELSQQTWQLHQWQLQSRNGHCQTCSGTTNRSGTHRDKQHGHNINYSYMLLSIPWHTNVDQDRVSLLFSKVMAFTRHCQNGPR